MDSATAVGASPPTGFPIRKSPDLCPLSGFPGLIAAGHVLHRLLAPRHPPRALCSLTTFSCDQRWLSVLRQGNGSANLPFLSSVLLLIPLFNFHRANRLRPRYATGYGGTGARPRLVAEASLNKGWLPDFPVPTLLSEPSLDAPDPR